MSSGQLRKHEQFRSKTLRNKRDLIVYLPPGYEEQPWRRFPVLYLHDGQNLFDPATSYIPGNYWHVGESADYFINEGRVAPLIIVGIYNTGRARIREYTPTKVARLGGGRADLYAKFLVNELKPFIDREYRTLGDRENTGLGGSSLGGLVSIYFAMRMPHIFGKLAALSPSVWWNQKVILQYVEEAEVQPHPRVWLDVGTNEGPRTAGDVQHLRDVLLRKGWQEGNDLHFELVQGGEHTESAWAGRVGGFLQFLFPVG